NDTNILGDCIEDAVGRFEWTIDRAHEYSPKQAEHRAACAVACGRDDEFGARRFRWIICWLENLEFGAQHVEGFGASINMIPERHHIDAGRDQIVINPRRDARAACGILGVGNDKIELFPLHQPAQLAADNLPPRLAHDVTDQKNPHTLDACRWLLAPCYCFLNAPTRSHEFPES